MMRRFAIASLLLFAVSAGIPAFAQGVGGQPPGAVPTEQPPRAGVTADTTSPVPYIREISQTSVWPGDRFTYTIKLTVPAGMKIALDDFDRKAVVFKPFALTDTQQVTEELEDGVMRYTFVYLLSNYEIGDRTIEIPRVIFHYEKSQPSGREPATAEVEIPPQPIAIRSTLTGPAKQSWIQESLRADVSPSRAWVMWMSLGIAGIVISLIPLVVWGVAQVPQWRNRERKMSQSKFLAQCGRSLGVLGKGMDKGIEEVKRQYESLEGVAHQYAQYFWDIPAAGLTGEELTKKLEKRSVSAKQAQVLAKVIDHGHNCRYSASSTSDWPAIFQQDLRDMKNAVGTKQ